MLREDHREVERMFKSLEKSDPVDRALLSRICDELVRHTEVENAIFYPAVRQQVQDTKDTVLESYEEHHVVDLLIAESQREQLTDEQLKAKATVMIELVRHHVEEEEKELFPTVRESLGRKRLTELGEQMQQFKQEFDASDKRRALDREASELERNTKSEEMQP